jgi:hypothetical protein
MSLRGWYSQTMNARFAGQNDKDYELWGEIIGKNKVQYNLMVKTWCWLPVQSTSGGEMPPVIFS